MITGNGKYLGPNSEFNCQQVRPCRAQRRPAIPVFVLFRVSGTDEWLVSAVWQFQDMMKGELWCVSCCVRACASVDLAPCILPGWCCKLGSWLCARVAPPNRRHTRRQINNVLLVTGDEQFRSIILMLKMFESSNHASFKDLATSLAGIAHGHILAACGRVGRQCA